MKFISKIDSDDIKLGKVYDGEIIHVMRNSSLVEVTCEDGKDRLFDIKYFQSLTEFRENILNQLLN